MNYLIGKRAGQRRAHAIAAKVTIPRAGWPARVFFGGLLLVCLRAASCVLRAV
jgi:hypothetical protein